MMKASIAFCQVKKFPGAGKVLPGNVWLDKKSRCCAVVLGEGGFPEVPSMDKEGLVRKECT